MCAGPCHLNHTFAISEPYFCRVRATTAAFSMSLFPTSRLPGSIGLLRAQSGIKRLPQVRWTSTAIIPSDLRNVSTAISTSCKSPGDQAYQSPTAARLLSPLISPPERASLAKLSFRFGKTMGEVTVRQEIPTKKKWFQVTRFPALLSTGMHGTEHCVE
jgi:hypothetical protein